MLNTCLALNMRIRDDGKWLITSFEGLRRYNLYPGNYFCVREFRISRNLKNMVIIIKDGNGFLHKIKWKENGAVNCNWKLAKLHLQIGMQMQGTGRQHTFVHFLMPSVTGISLESLRLSGDSVLFSLLSPHLRHTEAINYKVVLWNGWFRGRNSEFRWKMSF